MALAFPLMKQTLYRSIAYTNLTNVLQFRNEDERTWWEETASIIGNIMERADYDILRQYSYLLFFHEIILSALGPCPRPDSTPQWKSFMTDDFTPMDVSWNFSANSSLVRFAIEPIGSLAGTPHDLFNSYEAIEFLERIRHVSLIADLDLQWFTHFANCITIQNDKAQHVTKEFLKNEHMSQIFFALDLDHSKVSMKSYLFPNLKSIESGISPLDLVSKAIAQLSNESTVNCAWSSVEDYMRSTASGSQCKLEFVALDCVNPLQSRIKVYFRTPCTAFDQVRDIFTLGGRLKDETTRTAVETLKELWWLVLNLSDEVLDTDELVHRDQSQHPTVGTLFNFEIKPGKNVPEPKVYIPVRHYARSDIDIAQGLTRFFQRCQWLSLADSYMTNLKDIL